MNITKSIVESVSPQIDTKPAEEGKKGGVIVVFASKNTIDVFVSDVLEKITLAEDRKKFFENDVYVPLLEKIKYFKSAECNSEKTIESAEYSLEGYFSYIMDKLCASFLMRSDTKNDKDTFSFMVNKAFEGTLIIKDSVCSEEDVKEYSKMLHEAASSHTKTLKKLLEQSTLSENEVKKNINIIENAYEVYTKVIFEKAYRTLARQIEKIVGEGKELEEKLDLVDRAHLKLEGFTDDQNKKKQLEEKLKERKQELKKKKISKEKEILKRICDVAISLCNDLVEYVPRKDNEELKNFKDKIEMEYLEKVASEQHLQIRSIIFEDIKSFMIEINKISNGPIFFNDENKAIYLDHKNAVIKKYAIRSLKNFVGFKQAEENIKELKNIIEQYERTSETIIERGGSKKVIYLRGDGIGYAGNLEKIKTSLEKIKEFKSRVSKIDELVNDNQLLAIFTLYLNSIAKENIGLNFPSYVEYVDDLFEKGNIEEASKSLGSKLKNFKESSDRLILSQIEVLNNAVITTKNWTDKEIKKNTHQRDLIRTELETQKKQKKDLEKKNIHIDLETTSNSIMKLESELKHLDNLENISKELKNIEELLSKDFYLEMVEANKPKDLNKRRGSVVSFCDEKEAIVGTDETPYRNTVRPKIGVKGTPKKKARAQSLMEPREQKQPVRRDEIRKDNKIIKRKNVSSIPEREQGSIFALEDKKHKKISLLGLLKISTKKPRLDENKRRNSGISSDLQLETKESPTIRNSKNVRFADFESKSNVQDDINSPRPKTPEQQEQCMASIDCSIEQARASRKNRPVSEMSKQQTARNLFGDFENIYQKERVKNTGTLSGQLSASEEGQNKEDNFSENEFDEFLASEVDSSEIDTYSSSTENNEQNQPSSSNKGEPVKENQNDNLTLQLKKLVALNDDKSLSEKEKSSKQKEIVKDVACELSKVKSSGFGSISQLSSRLQVKIAKEVTRGLLQNNDNKSHKPIAPSAPLTNEEKFYKRVLALQSLIEVADDKKSLSLLDNVKGAYFDKSGSFDIKREKVNALPALHKRAIGNSSFLLSVLGDKKDSKGNFVTTSNEVAEKHIKKAQSNKIKQIRRDSREFEPAEIPYLFEKATGDFLFFWDHPDHKGDPNFQLIQRVDAKTGKIKEVKGGSSADGIVIEDPTDKTNAKIRVVEGGKEVGSPSLENSNFTKNFEKPSSNLNQSNITSVVSNKNLQVAGS